MASTLGDVDQAGEVGGKPAEVLSQRLPSDELAYAVPQGAVGDGDRLGHSKRGLAFGLIMACIVFASR